MGIFRRLRSTLFPSRAEREFQDEARFHFDELIDRFRAEGLPLDDARERAACRLGNMTLLRDRSEASARLRDFAPFAGVLTSEERRQAAPECAYNF